MNSFDQTGVKPKGLESPGAEDNIYLTFTKRQVPHSHTLYPITKPHIKYRSTDKQTEDQRSLTCPRSHRQRQTYYKVNELQGPHLQGPREGGSHIVRGSGPQWGGVETDCNQRASLHKCF